MSLRHRIRLLVLAIVSGIASASLATPSDARVVRDDRGRAHTFAHAPRRIVSLLPSLTESVCVLGACDRLVGVDRYSNWPASVAALPKLGGLDDAQLERIAALKPDVVLAGASSRVIDRLDALGIAVFVLEAKTLDDVRRSLLTLARVVGDEGAGIAAWAAMEADMAKAAACVPPALKNARVYFEVSASPHAASAGSFIGETLARLGLGNAVPAALGPFPKLNPEYIVRARPDIVMAAQRNLAEMPARPGWAEMRALREGRACGFTSEQYDMLVRPGPRLRDAVRVVADCLTTLPTSAAP
ncbi:MAG TPA: helical backbone metal receptor [Burkholderiaceae bacterium]|nr:helical backbone metal receptor [Burkholderiaceae bacterium]